jgi:decaprenylphospho-beta-D-ribofuranose 2-oxidase
MGLTGVIVTANLRLQAIKSAYIRETVQRCANLVEVFERFEANQDVLYSVAWIDCLAAGDHLGRSILMLCRFAQAGPLRLAPPRPQSVPLELPVFVLSKYSVACFN